MRLPRLKSVASLVAFSLFFVVFSVAQEAKPIPYDHNPAAGNFYDINGFKMYTEVYGEGPPVLMIHGNNGDMSAFFKNIPHAELWIVPSSGHGTLIEHADEFNRKVDDFFTQPFKDYKPAN